MKQSKILVILTTAILLALLAVPFAAIPAMAADIELDETEGYVGDEIEISGEGFEPGEDYTIEFPSDWDYDDSSDEIDDDREFYESFDVPAVPGGEYTITVISTDEGETSEDEWTIDFTVLSKATASSSKVKVGDKITVSGNGFGNKSDVRIYLDDNDDYEVEKTTNSSGSFSSVSFTIPEISNGKHDLILEDEDDNEYSIEITVSPTVSVSSTEASIGDKITVSGNGFNSSSTISFYLDSSKLDETSKTNSLGTIPNSSITIPVVSSGKHTLKVIDEDGISLSVNITTLQSISISPATGPGDTPIKVTGQGFATKDTVTISMAGISIGTIETDSSGSFVVEVKAVKLPAGQYPVEASDGSRSSTKTFKITNSASLSKESGAVGSSITVNGNGFKINTAITIKFDGAEIAATTTNANGEFSTSFTVPPTTAGEHSVVVSDSVNPISLVFTAQAGAKLGATTGNIGSNFTITGNAYTPGSTVIVKYDSIQLATASTDGTGSFSVTVKVPASKGGNHNITISDGTTVTTTVFAVETKAPPVPTLISPIDYAKAASKTILTWEAVSDPSGVTYRLQISDDAEFSNILVDVPDITDITYTLPEGLKMASKKAPYYWRIKAIDGAFNESTWSAPQTYTIGLPGWAFALIIGGGVILLVGGYLFWKNVINRRFGY